MNHIHSLLNPPKLIIENTVPYKITNEIMIPKYAGIYLIHDIRGILYIGRTENLRRRFNEHLWKEKNELLMNACSKPVGDIKFSWFSCEFPRQIIEERKLIDVFKPICNKI